MKQTVLLLALLGSLLCLKAQSYVGTITVGSYTQRNVEVQLDVATEREQCPSKGASTPKGCATMTIFNVKFSYMMPVKLDVVIPSLTLSGTHLTGNNITPLSNGKRYDKYLVRNLVGTADGRHLTFSCLMGKKRLTFNGTRTLRKARTE